MLRERLKQGPVLVAPGVHDPMTARLIEQAGFEVAYVGGASFSYGQLAFPDLGVASLEEMREHIRRVREATRLPLVVDADCGFGDVLNVRRTVREYTWAGADAIQIEDQAFPKRCGHLVGKRLVSREEALVRLATALDSRPRDDVLIVARTDARTHEGLQEVVARVQAFERLGVDAVFPESLESVEEYRAVREAVDLPLVANMVEGGRSPDLSAQELQELGYHLVIFPGSLTRAIAHTVQEVLAALAREGSTRSVRHRMVPFPQLQEMLGYSQWMAYVDGIRTGVGARDGQGSRHAGG